MMVVGLLALLALLPYGYFVGKLESNLHQIIIAISLCTFFICFFICGVFARVITLFAKYPTHNTKGYDENFTPDYGREEGGFRSQGYNRKCERRMFKFAKAVGLIVEDEGKN